jgi:hypothetical protein
VIIPLTQKKTKKVDAKGRQGCIEGGEENFNDKEALGTSSSFFFFF